MPTDKYKTNQELTMRRAEEAKEKLKKALDKAGVNLDLVFFSPPITLVQFPARKVAFVQLPKSK